MHPSDIGPEKCRWIWWLVGGKHGALIFDGLRAQVKNGQRLSLYLPLPYFCFLANRLRQLVR